MTRQGLVYPAPALVIGLGRFGLAVLERLGHDWHQLQLSGADSSHSNLRLLWLHPEEDDEEAWRRQERSQLKIARHICDGDLPSLALDFVVLRSLGLVRYRDGTYQVAMPQDRGAIRASDLSGLEGSAWSESSKSPKSGETAGRTQQSTQRAEDTVREDDSARDEDQREAERLVRRRFFEWIDLHDDPVEAAEELRRKAESHPELDLFLSPLVHRIRQGQSPWVLLAAIQRCKSLAEKRDPSPWPWVQDLVRGLEPETASGQVRIPADQVDSTRQLRRGFDRLLDGLTPPPLPLSPDEEQSSESSTDAWEFVEDGLSLPKSFVPEPRDPAAPIDPFRLLNENWESTGWATEADSEERRALKALRVSHFRLGLFDHVACRAERPAKVNDQFGERLRLLGQRLHRGLVRLYVDLEREQVEERTLFPHLPRRVQLDDALKQSLKLLEELMIKPLEEAPDDGLDRELMSRLRTPGELPATPSRALRSLLLDQEAGTDSPLERRLQALGLGLPQSRPAAHSPLLHSIGLPISADAPGAECPPPSGTDPAIEVPNPGPRDELRKTLNREVRKLLDFSYLSRYRQRVTRTPPRLTVFVVGDMSEPFARLRTTTVLRDVHSELLRAFSSMFELHREGFDRALSIVPVLSMPHPADPFSGDPLEATRLEEAVIINSVQSVRRWVESVLPGAKRRISQIFVNGRVTDNAVLSLQDSVQETRDFLAFQIRNDLSRDDWLRRTAVGPGGDDFFASFACREVEFPAERAREYLSNRLVRQCLQQILEDKGPQDEDSKDGAKVEPPPEEKALTRRAGERLVQTTRDRAQGLAEQVEKAFPNLDLRSESRDIWNAFDEAFETRIKAEIGRLWRQLTQERGQMDSLVDDLRRTVAQELNRVLPDLRRRNDEDIERAATRGLATALAALEERRRDAYETLQEAEEERRRWEELCLRHQRPVLDPIKDRRKKVQEAAKAKPDVGPQRVGLVSWMLGAPATDTLLGTLLAPHLGAAAAGLLSATALTGLAGMLLWANTRKKTQKIETSIAALERTSKRLVEGEGGDLEVQRPSLQTFLDCRLKLTAALARRNFALQSYEQAERDEELGQRLRESLQIQNHSMLRRAEDLGVRPGSSGSEEKDDLRDLFARGAGTTSGALTAPQELLSYYESRVREDDLPISDLLAKVGGLGEWRKSACLSDAEAVMSFGRELFGSVVARPLGELDYFSESAGRHLRDFVHRNFSNLGFGAKFLGYEGLDPDGVRLAADASLVANRELIQVYQLAEERALDAGEGRTWPRSLDLLEANIRPNAAYMLSLAQGIRAHSVHNLKRFESFHDRSDAPPDDPPLITPMTGYQDGGKRLTDLLWPASHPEKQGPETQGPEIQGPPTQDDPSGGEDESN